MITIVTVRFAAARLDFRQAGLVGLPDCYAVLANKKLQNLELWGAADCMNL